jgi:aminoglycoside phosphotransferase (APT) family kinase protein
VSEKSADEEQEGAGGGVKGIRIDRISEWLEANIDGVKPPFDFSLITGGRSNLTYRVTDSAGFRFVVRRPPTGSVLATAHDMAREHRLISALWPSEVPVPEAIGLCEDVEVNDAPFYVMNFVEGSVIVSSLDAQNRLDEAARGRLSGEVARVLAALHAVDPDEVGLGDLAKREDYVARQLKRWQGQWEKSKTRELAAMDEVYEALLQEIPEQIGSGVVHGDYRLGNMLVDGTGRVQAILDWELGTLGDPLADLGYLLNNWAEVGEDVGAAGAALSPTSVAGFWSRNRIAEHYREISGREFHSVNYYRAFQYWRLAAIVEGVLARYIKGVMGDKIDTSVFSKQVDDMAGAALELVREF